MKDVLFSHLADITPIAHLSKFFSGALALLVNPSRSKVGIHLVNDCKMGKVNSCWTGTH